GSWGTLGRILDAQCAVACAHCALARPRIFQPRVESTRSALLRFDCALLDWPQVVEHLSRILYRSVSTTPAGAAHPVRHTPASGDSRVFCSISSCRLGVAMDT